MIIVFFHVLYLLGKFIYRNYREDDVSDDKIEGNTGELEVSAGIIEENQVEEKDLYSNFYDEDESENIKFTPPAYLQRYQAVAHVLSEGRYEGVIRKVVDFGCSELGFFQHLKNTRGIEEILCVDVDRTTLEKNEGKIDPLTSDYLACRDIPLVVHVLEGSVTDSDQYLENTDAVICIELIEHLYPETGLNFPFNIFGFIQPKVAIFTTPNADFNVLFKRMTGFRHWDHKFEWSREQFQDWANNIITRYPNYDVQFTGICAGPPGSEALGHCSQMAIFRQKHETTLSPGTPGLFNLVKTLEYPYRIDNRSLEEKTLQEAVYYLRHYSFNSENESMPLELLAKWIDTVSVSTLKEILIKDGWHIIDHEDEGLSVLIPPLSDYSELDDINDDDYDDDDNNDAYQQWDEQSGPPAYQSQDWPEIHDQDEENWDNDLDDEHDALRLDSIKRKSIKKSELLIENHEMKKDDDKLIKVSSSHGQSQNNEIDDDKITLHSICSMYLQPSTCENDQTCPENITNPDFQLSKISNDDFYDERQLCSINDSPNVTSTPVKRKKMCHRDKKPETIGEFNENDVSQGESSGEYAEVSDHCSSCQIEKFEIMRKLKNTLLMKNSGNDGIILKNSNSSSNENAPQSSSYLEHDPTFDTNDKSSVEYLQNSSAADFKSLSLSTSDQFYSLQDEKEDNLIVKKIEDFNESKEILDVINEILKKESSSVKQVDDKAFLEARGSPPNSWSPEIMDSGYPNTSSAHDITPEYDLSSIGQDRISESESPSLAEPPRLMEAHVAVENGDLVNNNRDGEGNNVIPIEEDLEDLAPLINELENDLENENDIYDFRNGFPIWLLRILDAERAVNIHRDEGFDDDDDEVRREVVDENENVDD